MQKWASDQLLRVTQDYLGPDGNLITQFSADGKILKPDPLVPDLGDVLPFAAHFGEFEFAKRQTVLARKYLNNGLFSGPDGVRLFLNHDWMLGLVELYELTSDPDYLDMAIQSANSLIDRFLVHGFLLDREVSFLRPRSMLLSCSPFNLGYLEIFLDLYKATNEKRYLLAAKQIGSSWCKAPSFSKRGLFVKRPIAFSEIRFPFFGGKCLLFKENTNAVWGLLSLLDYEPEICREYIVHWLRGFEKYFFNDGKVFLKLDVDNKGSDISLLAAFSSIDLLCDISSKLGDDNSLSMAKVIADKWLNMQWPNGLFPVSMGKNYNHLDANVDMCVSLYKLSGMTGDLAYAKGANRCREAILKYHDMRSGYALAVSERGEIHDSRIVVKYQALILKLEILSDDPFKLLRSEDLLNLLRDR